MNRFQIKLLWKEYLKHAGLKEELMPPDQIRETRRAFYGACGQMMLMLRDELSKYPEKAAVVIMQDMLNQVVNFWNAEAQREN
jgi:hypothetical protein